MGFDFIQPRKSIRSLIYWDFDRKILTPDSGYSGALPSRSRGEVGSGSSAVSRSHRELPGREEFSNNRELPRRAPR